MIRSNVSTAYRARTLLAMCALSLAAACGEKADTNVSGDATASAVGDSTPTMAPAASMMANTPARELEGTTWRLLSTLGTAGARDSAIAPADLTFSGGRMTGSTGCNNMLASYKVDGQSLTVMAGASTKKACEEAVMKQEMAMLTHLPNIATYVIASDQLYLVSSTGDNLLIFAPAPATP